MKRLFGALALAAAAPIWSARRVGDLNGDGFDDNAAPVGWSSLVASLD